LPASHEVATLAIRRRRQAADFATFQVGSLLAPAVLKSICSLP